MGHANFANDAVLHTAIDWMVRLQSGQTTPDEHTQLQAWCDADPRHAQAWQRVHSAMQSSLMPLQSPAEGAAPSRAVRNALLRPPSRRKALGTALAVAGLGVFSAWMLRHTAPAALWLTDLRTGTGERRSQRLDDGSEIVLNARSAVDVVFDGTRRNLYLRTGEIIVTAAPDASRPLVVHTTEGQVQALGTRFLVRQEDGQTVATVMEHSVQVRTRSGAEKTLAEGDGVRFDVQTITPLAAAQAQALPGWERGMLVVQGQPLAEVIAALRPYRHGFIRLSPAAAELQVLGAFNLDDTDRVLDALAQTLPLRLTRHGGWLVTIDRADNI